MTLEREAALHIARPLTLGDGGGIRAALLDVVDDVDADAQGLAEQREQARRDGDFARADQIRDELAALGYEVRDRADGPPMLVRVEQ